MKSFIRRFWFVAAIVVSVASCEGSLGDPTTPGDQKPVLEYEFQEGVKYYDDALASYVSLINDTTMFIASSMPSEKQPEAGNVILCPCTSGTPHGFLRRVTSIESVAGGLTVYTESATLEDAFYTLKFDQEINLADHVKELRDSLGNEVSFEVVSGAVWDKLTPEDTTSLDDVPTKVAWEGDVNSNLTSLAFPVENRFFSGRVFLEQKIHLKFDLSFGKSPEISYVTRRKVGISGSFQISSHELTGNDYSDDLEIPLFERAFSSPTGIGYGPIQFYPNVVFGGSLVGNIDMSLKSNFRYILEHSESTFTYKDGKEDKSVTNLMDKSENYMKLVSAELEGELGVKGTAGFELRLWNGDVLAFGVEAGLKYGMEFANRISMSDTQLLINCDSVTVRPSFSLEMFAESYLIDKRDHRVTASIAEKEWNAFAIRLFPAFEYKILDATGSDPASGPDADKLIVQPTVKPASMMQTTEEGFALFASDEPDKPIVHVKLPSEVVSDPSGSSDIRDIDREITTRPIEFDLPSPDKSYFVKPYVVAGGNHYYGEGEDGQRLVKRIIIDGNSIDFTYDNNGRLVSVVDTWHGYRYSYDYSSEDVISVHFKELGDDWSFVSQYFLSDGQLVKSVLIEDTYLLAYTDGYLSKVNEEGDNWSATYQYADGNMAKVGFYEGSYMWKSVTVEYGIEPDKSNIDINMLFSVEGFDDLHESYFIPWLRMPGISNNNICRSYTCYVDGEFDFKYSFSRRYDDAGYMTGFTKDDYRVQIEYY